MTNPESAQQDIVYRLRKPWDGAANCRQVRDEERSEAADLITALRKQVEDIRSQLVRMVDIAEDRLVKITAFEKQVENLTRERDHHSDLREQYIAEADASISRAEAAEAELAALGVDNRRLKRTATDRAYMLQAYKEMLGPVALQLVKRWEAKGVQRQHTYWGPDAHKLTGEERAQVLLDAESAIFALPSSKNGGDL